MFPKSRHRNNRKSGHDPYLETVIKEKQRLAAEVERLTEQLKSCQANRPTENIDINIADVIVGLNGLNEVLEGQYSMAPQIIDAILLLERLGKALEEIAKGGSYDAQDHVDTAREALKMGEKE